jgi:hypothetical protein
VSTSTVAPAENGVASVETLQGYLELLDAILRVCAQAEQREGDTRSQASRGKAILALCREHVCGHLERLAHPHRTAWERGFAELLESLWDTISPMPDAGDAELMRRVQKAQRLAGTLEKLLSSLIVLESVYPHKIEEALVRYYDDRADGDLPF